MTNQEISPDEITDLILSFNDPNLIANVFRQVGWNPSLELTETLKLARQDSNLNVKLRALKHLRELMREAAEASGIIANVSQSHPLPGGGSTTFSAKRIVTAMNPTKQIESKQIGENNEREQERTKEKFNRTSNRTESREKGTSAEQETGISPNEINGDGDDGLGKSTDEDDREAPRPSGGCSPDAPTDSGATAPSDNEHPCAKIRRPECDLNLFPGISAGSGGK